MRYIVMVVKGNPPKEKPCGMNDIVGIGTYLSPRNAIRFKLPVTDYRRASMVAKGFTHIAVYAFPESYAIPCSLVHQQIL